MKNMVKLQAMLRIAGIIALTALIVFTMAGCDPEPEDNTGGKNNTPLQPVDVTITIKNTLTGMEDNTTPGDIKGVKVYAFTDSDRGVKQGDVGLIGTRNTYDTNYTVAVGGNSITLPKVTVPVLKDRFDGADKGWALRVRVDLGSATYAYIELDGSRDNPLPSSVTLELYYLEDTRYNRFQFR
jgi:hypothetical protein